MGEEGFWVFSQLTSRGNRMMGLSPVCGTLLCFISLSLDWSRWHLYRDEGMEARVCQEMALSLRG